MWRRYSTAPTPVPRMSTPMPMPRPMMPDMGKDEEECTTAVGHVDRMS
jgi:hypothetical protein